MLSDEEKEIFNNLKDYMQSKIDNGYHKFIYNDLDWDFKCIDCINAIDNALKQSKEIERLNEILIWKQKHEEQLQKEIEDLKEENKEIRDWKYVIDNPIDLKKLSELDIIKIYGKSYIAKDKIKAKIEEIEKVLNKDIYVIDGHYDDRYYRYLQDKKVLQSLLEKE